MKKRMSKAMHTMAVFLAAGLFAASSVAAAGGGATEVHRTGLHEYDGFADFPRYPIDLLEFGPSTDTGAPCADLACNAGDTCDCMIGSARSLGPTTTSGSMAGPHVGSMTYELSMDETAAMDDGTNTGKCMPATGNGVIKLKDKKTIDFVMSGLDCTVSGVEPQGMFNGTVRLNGGTFHHGKLEGLGSIKIGDIGGTTEVIVSVAVDASGGFQ